MSTVPDWLPGVERIAGTSDAGPMMPGSKWSLLLHTDEIDQDIEACVRALRAKSAWSTFIYDWHADRLVQCVSNNRAAKSLRSGGNLGRTNAARVVQVEIVGRSHDSPNWSALRNQRVGAMIARLHEHIPFRLEMPLPFYGDASGFTVASKTARQRMSWAAWYRFDAICGHQHAPANDHWDPGAINTAEILAAARGARLPNPPAPIPAPSPDQLEELELMTAKDDILRALRPTAHRLSKDGPTGSGMYKNDVWIVGPGWRAKLNGTGGPVGQKQKALDALAYSQKIPSQVPTAIDPDQIIALAVLGG